MKYFQSTRAPAWAKCCLALSAVFIFAVAPMNDAQARQKVLTGEIPTQWVCHDGANRGATVGLELGIFDQRYTWYTPFLSVNRKGYYTQTTCHDLSEYAEKGDFIPGQRIFVWYHRGRDRHLCNFYLKYVTDGSEMWVQNGGATYDNINCVAKDGL